MRVEAGAEVELGDGLWTGSLGGLEGARCVVWAVDREAGVVVYEVVGGRPFWFVGDVGVMDVEEFEGGAVSVAVSQGPTCPKGGRRPASGGGEPQAGTCTGHRVE